MDDLGIDRKDYVCLLLADVVTSASYLLPYRALDLEPLPTGIEHDSRDTTQMRISSRSDRMRPGRPVPAGSSSRVGSLTVHADQFGKQSIYNPELRWFGSRWNRRK
jgi:hypothetical protein